MEEENLIRLSPNKNSLTFELGAISYHLPHLNTLKHRLLPISGDWKVIKNGETINFPSLAPGTYNLEIVGVNSNNLEGPLKNIQIIIDYPLSQYLWFQLLSLIPITGLIYFFIRLNFSIREKRINEVQEERNRIGQELHDDLGGGLTSIQYIADDLLNSSIIIKEKQELQKISKRTVELAKSMDTIIWALDKRSNSLKDLLVQIRLFSESYLKENAILLSSDYPTDVPQIKLFGEMRRNIYLIIKESLHNVVKHSKANLVNLNIDLDPKKQNINSFLKNGLKTLLLIKPNYSSYYFQITIEDNGQGFDFERTFVRSRGLKNIFERTQKLNGEVSFISKEGIGTKISLIIPIG